VTLANPIRLDRFQRGLVAFLADVCGVQAAWAYGAGSRETMPDAFVNLTLASGPSLPVYFGRGTSFAPVTSVGFVVTSAVVGGLVMVRVNDIPYRVQVSQGATPSTIRDSLVAQITADDSGEYSAAAGLAAGQWTLTPATFGAIWQLASVGAITATPTISSSLAKLTQGRAVASVALDVFSRSTSPRSGAWSIANRIAVGLQLPSVAQTFRDWGFGMGVVGPLADLSSIAGGASWQSRVRFAVQFNLQFTAVVPIDRIERVEIGAAISPPLLQFTETTTP
jgi:hypothetical protein